MEMTSNLLRLQEAKSVSVSDHEPGTIIEVVAERDSIFLVVVVSPEDDEVVVKGKAGPYNEGLRYATLHGAFLGSVIRTGCIAEGAGVRFDLAAGGTLQVLKVVHFAVRSGREDIEEGDRIIAAAAN
ncbi:MAG: hypothetical protein V2A55_00640 [Candidatus Jorgensenbacteria bacterium]